MTKITPDEEEARFAHFLADRVVTRHPDSVEFVTIAVMVGALALVVAAAVSAPNVATPVTLLVLAVAAAWWQSFQHEVVHGHPTPWRWLNELLASLPVGLMVPYWLLRNTHLEHHIDDQLTSPLEDPESPYVTPAAWARASALRRALLVLRRTLVGRVFIGPMLVLDSVVKLLWVVPTRLVSWLVGDAFLIYLLHVMGLPWWQSVLGLGYFGSGLASVRSFAEHRAGPVGYRTAIVESNWWWSLLFLNNNLHVTHHRVPGLPWYKLPAAVNGEDLKVATSGAGLHRGYSSLLWSNGLRRLDGPVHPLSEAGA